MSSITIRGIDALQRKLGKAAANNVLQRPMQRAVLMIESEMKVYPPQRPGSRYVRGRGMANSQGQVTRRTSENLGKRWTSKVYRVVGGIRGKVGNNASYAPWVQSERFQARIHTGRWQTDKDVVDRLEPRIVVDFQRSIDKALSE